MDNIKVSIITKSSQLPPMTCNNFLHSTELFRIAESTSGQTPYMVVTQDQTGKCVAHMLALLRWHGTWIPPFIYKQGRVYGEGEYEDSCENKEQVFGLMLYEINRFFRRKLALYTEFSALSQKMFGYQYFRQNKYFPMNWQEIHNSLHSMPPESRLSKKTLKRIAHAEAAGVTTSEVATTEELQLFYNHLKNHFRSIIRRFIPSEEMFTKLYQNQHTKTFITKYKNKLIGGCTIILSQGNAYLWYLASKRKTFYPLHPDTVTVWDAIKYAHANHCEHFYFLYAGLPFKKSQFREFILRFGGKPVTKFRWFRIYIPWVNRVFSWLYRQ